MNKILLIAVATAFLQAAPAFAQQRTPLLPEPEVAALANELSGETAKRNLEGLARFHRQRGSTGFHAAAELVAERARAYGLSDVAILQFPADGKIFYGTQRSRPGWDADVGELEEVAKVCAPASKINANEATVKLASYAAMPIVLAEDSESADVTAELVDVGEGTKETDYDGKNVKGKIVLASAQPGAVQDLAVGKFGAAGIVSYAQNQKTAWSGEDENLIRWGHLETFSANKTFAFMVSLKTARGLRERLARAETIRVHAVVKAGQHASNYEVVTATIPGADAKLKEDEIAFSCHLDHQRPGANDNASGCVTILEVARALQKLISEGKLQRPARTIRFYWPPEIEGTLALLTSPWRTSTMKLEVSKKYDGAVVLPQTGGGSLTQTGRALAERIKAVIHMDMVGGGPATKAVFHVTRGPMSLPSFVHDVAWTFAEFVNEQSYKFASTGSADYPLVAPEGGKEPLRAEYSAYTMGSDHDVYQDSSFGIPAIYLNDWPDRYIHTNLDSAANIDPTKLKRAAFIGAASGYLLARLTTQNPQELADVRFLMMQGSELRKTAMFSRLRSLPRSDWSCEEGSRKEYDQFLMFYLSWFLNLSQGPKRLDKAFLAKRTVCGLDEQVENGGDLKYRRKTEPRGPVAVFGYDYLKDHLRAWDIALPKILNYEGLWGGGEEYAYEILNFVDSSLDAQQIRDRVSIEYGPVPLEMVLEYLQSLEKIGVVERVK
jgi:aminopeptidase YwaD